MGLLEIFTMILAILKLVGIIGISWFIVFLPLIIAMIIYITFYLVFGLTIVAVFKKILSEFK